jgi:tetratricopeptide (TPR) repeat protein
MEVPFVGRNAEMTLLRDAWRAVRDGGEGRVALVIGGPGTGKTALLRQFLAVAAPKRATWVDCAAMDQEPSRQVLRDVAAGLSAWTGSTIAWADSQDNAVQAGVRLLDEFKIAGPLVLVADDVQWADRRTREVLWFTARHLRGTKSLLLMACHEDAGDDWRRMFPDAPGEVLDLAGLSAEELVSLAVLLGRPGLSPAGAVRLREHTAGNPLFATEVLRRVAVRDINAGHGPLPAPRSITEVVKIKIGECAAPARKLGAAAAVIGTDFDLSQAAALAELADAAPALDELIAVGLVAEVPATAARRFRFAHGLVRQAVYDQSRLTLNRELHRRAAALPGGKTDGRAALRHRVAAVGEAGTGADPELPSALDRAAQQQLARGDLAAAAACWRDALALTPDGPERRSYLLRLVENELIAGNAAAVAGHAAELKAGGGDPWWDYVTGYQCLLDGDVDAARERLGRALAAVDTARPPGAPADLRARIATQLAIIALVALSYQEMVDYGEIAVSAGSADPRVQAFAWLARTLGLTLAGHGADALADLARRDPRHDLDQLSAFGIAQLWTDDIDGAIAQLTEAVRRAYQGEPLRVAQALAFLGEAEYRRGKLAESVLHTEQAVLEAEAGGRVWDYALLHALACQSRAAAGDWAEAESHAREAGKSAEFMAQVLRRGAVRLSAAGSRALLEQARGNNPGALLRAAEEVEAVLDAPEPGITLLGPIRAEALAQLGDADAADQALAAYTARYLSSGRSSALMAVSRVRGRIAAARGAHDSALTDYVNALGLADSLGLRLEAARIEMLIGASLAASRRLVGGGMRLRAALRFFTQIGANAYAAQAEALIRRYGLRFDDLENPFDPLADLSDAKREIVRLVGEGLPNKAIGEREAVRISKSAVEQHLRDVYDDLGLGGHGSRAALRRLLNGLG